MNNFGVTKSKTQNKSQNTMILHVIDIFNKSKNKHNDFSLNKQKVFAQNKWYIVSKTHSTWGQGDITKFHELALM